MISLSIIVPVYNVENYIRSSIESIYRQGLDENSFEIIIVNDGTNDKSMEMIADIIKEHSNITVLEQDNQGLSVARNNGIATAKGEYIFMPDSDDLLIDNSLPTLLNKAIETKADLIVADFLRMDDKEIVKFEGVKENPFHYVEKTGQELMLEDLNPGECYVWRALYRRQFLIQEQIKFVPGVFYQDVPFTHECYLKAGKCIRTSMLLNIYRVHRRGAATSSFNVRKAKNLCIVISKTWELRKYEHHTSQTLLKLENDVFASFSLLIRSATKVMGFWNVVFSSSTVSSSAVFMCLSILNPRPQSTRLTSYSNIRFSERKDILKYLRELAPDLFFKNGIKQQITSILFRTMPNIYLDINIAYRKTKKYLKAHF